MHGHAAHVPIVVRIGLDDEAVAVRAMGEGAQDSLVSRRLQAAYPQALWLTVFSAEEVHL